jgi:3D (Asp-Asp-Asp) domain-containing protein
MTRTGVIIIAFTIALALLTAILIMAQFGAPLPLDNSKIDVQIDYRVAEPVREYIGEFTVTAFCPCVKCCGIWSNPDNPVTASGYPALEGVTVGADWATLPVGTVIEIEGIGRRTVQDKPAGWIVEKYDGKVLDLFFSRHEDALKFGKQILRVWRCGE